MYQIRVFFVFLLVSLILSIVNYSKSEVINTNLSGLGKKQINNNWVLIYKKPLSLNSELTHYYWEKEMPPHNGAYDKIGLHRLVNENIKAKATIFVLAGMTDEGRDIISDQFLENTYKAAIKKGEQYEYLLEEINTFNDRLISRFLASNGYDVYTVDYRTTYIPEGLSGESLSFMKNWGWDLFVGDVKAAIEKSKDVSHREKVYLAGESFGGMLTMNYTSRYWQDDLLGFILLDGGNGGRFRLRIPLEVWKLIESDIINNIPELPDWSYVDGLTPRIIQSLLNIFGDRILFDVLNMYSFDKDTAASGGTIDIMSLIVPLLNEAGIPVNMFPMPHYESIRKNAFNNVLSPPIDPVTGIYLEPYNPETNKPFETYLEWYHLVGYLSPLEGLFSNSLNGTNTALGQTVNMVNNTRHWPMKVLMEAINMFEFELTTSNEAIELLGFKINFNQFAKAFSKMVKDLQKKLPYKELKLLLSEGSKSLSEAQYDYVNNYKNIDIPLLGFQSKLGLLGWGHLKHEIRNKDVTDGGEYPEFGHIDIYTGFNVEKVNTKVLKWLDSRSSN